ncbi:uncharacterized protein G2W53_009067 [Senna tora]|uniref:Uncharacterized protein n=1 Tax=Senna tora TaxID=362788 RepID=A0A834WY99_9FABA|nr:uncharacterized protein G2W53_009067 [Senna tora]
MLVRKWGGRVLAAVAKRLPVPMSAEAILLGHFRI